MNRGDIYWADLGPPAGRRPVVILTRDVAILVLRAVLTVPVTTTIRGISSEVQLGPEEGLLEDCVASCDTLWTVPKIAFDPQPVGSLGVAKLVRLDRALRFALEIRY
ncbi:MAG TPA: type II toxin-antitoxin system PemK/MazF family toxin [Actinomycetota bacterium]|nr:type II toxin-antitoxin system PemK/MazF family toxin [Actinomycetota bacterium]